MYKRQSLANAVEADDLKAILTDQQFERLREATSNFDHFWDQKRRLKRAKEKAADRRKNGEEEEDYEDKEGGEGANAPALIKGAIKGGTIRIEGGKGIIIKGGGAQGIEIKDDGSLKEEVQ